MSVTVKRIPENTLLCSHAKVWSDGTSRLSRYVKHSLGGVQDMHERLKASSELSHSVILAFM